MKVYSIEEDLSFTRSGTLAVFRSRKKAEAVARQWGRRDKSKYIVLEWDIDVST